MILKEENFESSCICQTEMNLFVTFQAKQVMIEYYRYIIKLTKCKRGLQYRNCLHLPVQKAIHLNCFWTLFPYLLLQVCPVVAAETCYVELHVKRNSSECLHMPEMPAQLQEYQNALLLYIEASKLEKATLLDLYPPLPLLAKETLFDLKVDL